MSLYLKKRKKFLKKVFVGASLFLIGSFSFFILSLLLKHFSFTELASQPSLPLFVLTVIFISAYKPLDLVFTQFFKNYLFKQKSYAHLTLMNLAEELTLILDLQEMANLVVNTFGEVLHLKTVTLMVPNPLRGDYEVISSYGWNISDARRARFSKDTPLIEMIHESGSHVLVRDRVVRTLSWQEANKLASDFDRFRSSWVVPLFVKDNFVGALGFASASPEAMFDEADFQFFREFAITVAKSLRNASSFSELSSANIELQDVQSQLLQTTKLAAIEQLATGIAHEIHNPLTIISGKAQVLLLQKDRENMDERVEEVLKTIVKQTKRAADITRKLLMFSQSSGSPKETLKMDQVLEDTIALVSYQTSLEGIEISRSVLGKIPPFYGNVHELREIFLNLILNAVQSIGSKGRIECELSYRAADQIMQVRIQDNGRGVPPDCVDKLFNPFFTTRPDAVGLGLFLTKQIVHRYGGSIRVESRLGSKERRGGTLFILQFPYMDMSGLPLNQSKKEPMLFDDEVALNDGSSLKEE